MLDFYKGVDISFLPEQEDAGTQMRDLDGAVMEPFALLKKNGVNAVRLRLWHTPEHVPQARGYCSLPHTIAMARRIRAQGMSFMLDFHYSDFWADPAKQNKPLDWEALSGKALETAVYEYTRDTLLVMKNEGVLPDIVQIGNEIRSGLLFPDGELPDWDGMVRLVNAGIRGARDAADSSELQVMIHLDQGGRYFFIHDWFERAKKHGLADFDLIGLSYYPFWHGTFADLKETLEKLAEEYKKPLMVVETAHAWRRGKDGFIDREQERIAGIEASPRGQRRVLELVENILASLPERMGRGFYYWEPLCVPREGAGGWAYNMGILDQEGRAMEAIRAFAFERKDLKSAQIAKIYGPPPIRVHSGDSVPLPESVRVLFFDGHLEERSVEWQKPDPAGEERQQGFVTGRVEGTKEQARAEIILTGDEMDGDNILQDANWDAGLVHWEVDNKGAQVYISPEFSAPFPAAPINTLCVESEKNFSFCISQKVTPAVPGSCYESSGFHSRDGHPAVSCRDCGPVYYESSGFHSRDGHPAGLCQDYGPVYCLAVEFCGTDTTGVEVRLFAEYDGGQKELVIHPDEQGFTRYEIGGLPYEKSSMKVGIRISAPPMRCRMRGFSLRRTKDGGTI